MLLQHKLFLQRHLGEMLNVCIAVGSLSQGFRSVRSWSALLFGDWAARYVVVVWSGVDVLSSLSRVVRGDAVSVVVVWSRCPEQLLASCPRSRRLRGCGLSLLGHDTDGDRLLVKVDADEVHCKAPGLGKRGNG